MSVRPSVQQNMVNSAVWSQLVCFFSALRINGWMDGQKRGEIMLQQHLNFVLLQISGRLSYKLLFFASFFAFLLMLLFICSNVCFFWFSATSFSFEKFVKKRKKWECLLRFLFKITKGGLSHVPFLLNCSKKFNFTWLYKYCCFIYAVFLMEK